MLETFQVSKTGFQVSITTVLRAIYLVRHSCYLRKWNRLRSQTKLSAIGEHDNEESLY